MIQYLTTIVLNKNIKQLKNRAIKVDMILVAITIIIPVILLRLNIRLDIFIVPLFVIFYALFAFLNNNVHKLYLENEKPEKENLNRVIDNKKTIKYVLVLIMVGVLLYIVGELLGNTLENLCNLFNVPQFIVGILLGFITSIPELITFFESQRHYKDAENVMSGVVEATNNLVTSNIVNLFVIQTIAIVVIYI